MLSIVV